MAKKKKLTTNQLKNKYNNISKATGICRYISMIIPYVIICIVNWNEYFVEYSGVKVSISFIMAMVVLCLTLYGAVNEKFKDTAWSLMVKFLIIAFICFMLGRLITDLAIILLCGAGGLLGSGILDTISKNYAKKRDLVKDAMLEAKKEQLKEQAKEENDLGSII